MVFLNELESTICDTSKVLSELNQYFHTIHLVKILLLANHCSLELSPSVYVPQTVQSTLPQT